MTVVAVVGVGRLGSAIVHRLDRAGYSVRACDVRAEVAPELPDDVTFTTNPAEAGAGADVVLTALPGSPELRTTMLGAGSAGLIARLGGGTTWVDLTSTAPDVGHELAAAARVHGIGYLDAPVGGGPDAVRDGRATLYVGGEAGRLDEVRPVLASFADRVEHMGANGAGYLTKLLVNLLWFTQAVAAEEALTLAQRGGLGAGRFADALAGSAASSAFVTDYLPRLLDGDVVESFGLDRCVEELDSLDRFAGELGLPHELTSLVTRLHRDALARFGPVDGELLGAALVAERAGQRLRAD